ncbi:homocysteine S-methyltransferase family protein [Neoroseomonas lacus]|uniref:Homocysteine S-methyltransferase n=1 Tax=Neoroseomonas lacus TaxID=287609 RepID=A0A917KEC5_9PROT|nr:homocysteine S-methyltransferase family protein [Neoroseomonas lacus]GGJ08742.1 homocysteine S-methyltransferase [Neoroseomonas lacus]
MPYRDALPQLAGRLFVTDGGLETTLIFHDGIDLPHFAAFPLLDRPEGRAALRRYYNSYGAAADRSGAGCLLDTPTFRASPDWAALVGYDQAALQRVIADAVSLLQEIRTAWETPDRPIVINGAIGPRGDGYSAEATMDAATAEAFHAPQVRSYAEAGADLVMAQTMTHAGEAIGIVRAAAQARIPSVVSFTVETDGRLPDGSSLRAAIEAVDAATGAAPAHYLVNCAHPTHVAPALAGGGGWIARLGGIRANPSPKSHAELNESTTLEDGDPDELAGLLATLRRQHRHFCVMGGCCGSDHRHAERIGLVCGQA